jgi:hypothetical protein
MGAPPVDQVEMRVCAGDSSAEHRRETTVVVAAGSCRALLAHAPQELDVVLTDLPTISDGVSGLPHDPIKAAGKALLALVVALAVAVLVVRLVSVESPDHAAVGVEAPIYSAEWSATGKHAAAFWHANSSWLMSKKCF